MEIPKDGKTYLAWHIADGLGFYCAPIGFIHYYKVGADIHWGQIPLDQFTRWMDENGVWHEVKNGNS